MLFFIRFVLFLRGFVGDNASQKLENWKIFGNVLSLSQTQILPVLRGWGGANRLPSLPFSRLCVYTRCIVTIYTYNKYYVTVRLCSRSLMFNPLMLAKASCCDCCNYVVLLMFEPVACLVLPSLPAFCLYII